MSIQRPLPALQDGSKVKNPDFGNISDRNYTSTILRYAGLATKFPQLKTDAKTIVAAINELYNGGDRGDHLNRVNPTGEGYLILGTGNTVNSENAIVSGWNNVAEWCYQSIISGVDNLNSNSSQSLMVGNRNHNVNLGNSIVGGESNYNYGAYDSVLSGSSNVTVNDANNYSIVSGARNILAGIQYSMISGTENYVNRAQASVIGGDSNVIINGNESAVFGHENLVTGSYSMAHGRSVMASGLASHAEGYGFGSLLDTMYAVDIQEAPNGKLPTGTYTKLHIKGLGKLLPWIVLKENGIVTTTSKLVSYPEVLSDSEYAEVALSPSLTVSNTPEAHIYTYYSNSFYSNSYTEWTMASGDGSHAEGRATHATGLYSHSEGTYTMASGEGSHAEGMGMIDKDFLNSFLLKIVGYDTINLVNDNQTNLDYYLMGKDANISTLHVNWHTTDTEPVYLDAGQPLLAARLYDYANRKWINDPYWAYIQTSEKVTIYPNTDIDIPVYCTNSISDPSHLYTLCTLDYDYCNYAYNAAAYRWRDNRTSAIGNYSHAEGILTKAYGVASHSEGGGLSPTESTGLTYSVAFSFDCDEETDTRMIFHNARVLTHAYIFPTNMPEYLGDQQFNSSTGFAFLDLDTGAGKGGTALYPKNPVYVRGGQITKFELLTPINVPENSYIVKYPVSGYGNSYKIPIGLVSMARGDYSHAEGLGTIATALAQHAQGKFNVEDPTKAVIVGNGAFDIRTSSLQRSNAYTLDWNGNGWFGGKATVSTEPTEDMDLVNLGLLNRTTQSKLIAGENITIEDNVISAQGGSDVTMIDNPDHPNAAVDLTVDNETKTLSKLGYGGRILDNEPPLAEIRDHHRTPISAWDIELYNLNINGEEYDTGICPNQSNKLFKLEFEVTNTAPAGTYNKILDGGSEFFRIHCDKYPDELNLNGGYRQVGWGEAIWGPIWEIQKSDVLKFTLEKVSGGIIISSYKNEEPIIENKRINYDYPIDPTYHLTIGGSIISQAGWVGHVNSFKFTWLTDDSYYALPDYDEVQLLRATDGRDLMPKTVAESVYFNDGTRLSDKTLDGSIVTIGDNPTGGVDISVDASTYTVAKQSDLVLKANASELTGMVKSVNNNLPDETGNVVIPSGGSTVSVQPITTSGTEIAQITIDGEPTSLYVPGGSGGSNVTLSDNVQDGGVDLSVDGTTRNLALQSDLKLKADSSKLAEKQDTLIAGANIQIADDGRTISATGGGEKTIVEVNPIYTTGTEIATITVDGTSTSLHAPSGGGSDVVMVDNVNGGVDLTVNDKTETLAKNADVLKYSKDAIGTINVYPIPKICFLTQAQYDGLATKDSDTLYVIKEA